jgi:dienelactone hydrolase
MTPPPIDVPWFVATPAVPGPWPSIVVMAEEMVITRQLLRVCRRLAGEGFAAAAPDMFWRFGGSDPGPHEGLYASFTRDDAKHLASTAADVLRARGEA